MKKALLYFAVSLLLLSATQAAQATIITFDDYTFSGSYTTLASGYAGFDWQNMGVANANYYTQSAGYANGDISAPNTAFNLSGNMASMSRATPFTLKSATFTSAWVTPNTVTVTGYLGGTQLYQSVFGLLKTTIPTQFAFNFANIDMLTFTTQVTPASLQWQSQFVMDNVVVNEATAPAPTPIPGAVWLLGSGILCLTGLRKRRNKG